MSRTIRIIVAASSDMPGFRDAGRPIVHTITTFRPDYADAQYGGPTTLQSRAIDEAGNTQPTRSQLIAERGNKAFYHFNAIAGWAVNEQGTLKHVYV